MIHRRSAPWIFGSGRFAARAFFVAAVAWGVAHCGSTDGGSGLAGSDQFVARTCSQAADCLSLQADNPQRVGQVGRFSARLVDASGAPLSRIQLCFAVEDAAATIIEPADSCGVTDAGGGVSGRMSPDIPGSYNMIAAAPAGFDLSTQILLKFLPATATGGAVGDPCSSDSDCQGGLFCVVGPCIAANPFNEGTCQQKGANGDACSCSNACTSNNCGEDADPDDDIGVCAP